MSVLSSLTAPPFFILHLQSIIHPMNRKFNPSILLVALAIVLGSISLNSCSKVSGENPGQEISPASLEIPQLLPRTEGLGSADERAQITQLYDEQIALLRLNGADPMARLTLAELFINEARITGEHPYYYPLALKQLEAIPESALNKDELKFRFAYLKSSVMLSQHDFKAGLAAGEAAQKIYPHNAGIYGVLIDAQVELGNYEEAVRLSDKMVSIRPDLRSYSRISYLREIHGEWKGAIEAMEMAVKAGVPGTEQTSWCRLTLGELYETYGDLDRAEGEYRTLLQERADYPFAYAGLASIEEKKGNLEEALSYVERAIALIPEVGFYEQKAGLLEKIGETEASQALVPEIFSMMQEDSESGHVMDLELAGVSLHLEGDAAKAKAFAEKAMAARPDNIDVQALMAEILFMQEDYAAAGSMIDKALRTSSQDPGKLLVAGMIKEKTNGKGEGKDMITMAFELNPYLEGALAQSAKETLF